MAELSIAQVSGNANRALGNYQYEGNAGYGQTPRQALPANVTAYILNDTVLEVDARVLANVHADLFIVYFNVTQVGATLDSTLALAQERIDLFRQGLSRLGIRDADVFVDFLSLVPQYEIQVERRVFSRRAMEIPSGFELQKNVHVRYRSSAQLEAILTAAVAAEIYDLIKVDYVVLNVEAVYDSLRATALGIAKRKIQNANALGANTVGHLTVVAENRMAFQPADRYAGYRAFARISLEATRRRNSNLPLPEPRQPVTQYYDRLLTTNYDAVLNAATTEPTLQVVLELRTRVTLERAAHE
jgi:uncharacterized protein YggE